MRENRITEEDIFNALLGRSSETPIEFFNRLKRQQEEMNQGVRQSRLNLRETGSNDQQGLENPQHRRTSSTGRLDRTEEREELEEDSYFYFKVFVFFFSMTGLFYHMATISNQKEKAVVPSGCALLPMLDEPLNTHLTTECHIKKSPGIHALFRMNLLFSGNQMAAEGNYEKALKNFEAIKKLHRISGKLSKTNETYEEPILLNNIGFCHLNLNKYQLALNFFDQSRKMDPTNCKTAYNQALACHYLGEIQNATRSLMDAIHYDEKNFIKNGIIERKINFAKFSQKWLEYQYAIRSEQNRQKQLGNQSAFNALIWIKEVLMLSDFSQSQAPLDILLFKSTPKINTQTRSLSFILFDFFMSNSDIIAQQSKEISNLFTQKEIKSVFKEAFYGLSNRIKKILNSNPSLSLVANQIINPASGSGETLTLLQYAYIAGDHRLGNQVKKLLSPKETKNTNFCHQ